MLADGRFVDVNDAFLAMFGYRRDEVVGKTSLELGMWFSPADRAALAAELRDRGVFRNREYPFLRRDGSTGWALCAAEKISLGHEDAVISLFSDITERRRAENALRLFRALLDKSNDAIEVIDPDTGRFLDVNERFCRDLGYSREEVLGLRVSDIDPTVEQPHWEENVRKLKQRGSALIEGVHQRKDGSTFPVEISTNWLHMERDYIVAIVRDITERRLADAALAESRRRLETLVANLPGAAYRSRNDRLWTTEYVSDGIAAITGHPAADFLAGRRQFGELIHEDDRDRVWTEVQRALDARRQHEIVYRIRAADGAEKWIWEQGRGIFGPDGGLQAIEGYLADITTQKQTEAGIRRLNRLYAVLSGINSLIVRERDRQRLYEQVCRIAVELGRFGLAWVGVVEPQTDSISPVAVYGPDEDRALVAGAKFTTRADRRGGRGIVGEAVRTRRPAYSNDLAAAAGADRRLAAFRRRGYRAAISLPLLTGATCVGVVVLHAKEAGLFDHEELALLSEIAADVSFALTYMEKEENAHYLAYHDPLTGLGNRARMQEQLVAALGRAGACNHACALLLLDINNFNDVNSTLGHQNGDLLLRQVADRIRSALWESDSVACLGGDEFAIPLPRLASSADIELVAGKLGHAMQAPFNVADLPITLEARMGYAIYPDHAGNAGLLWQRAGIALRGAKEGGRAYLAYEPGIDHFDPQRLALLSGVRRAIDADELELHFQPKVDLRRRRTTGVEALLRWRHPEQGLIYPDRFIPLVERTGLINPMTAWVLAHAMHQARIWDRAGTRFEIAVNLSVRNLQHPGLVTEILDLARSSRFPLQRLTLEVTESAIMVDPEHGKAMLHRLHAAGVGLSLDDFGVGHSSLAYLKDLPVSHLKIDKSFVIGLREPRNAAIVRAALELGHSLGMRVTAEGIEDAATYEALRELGCDVGQGYFFSRPLPADQLAAWLKQSPWQPAARRK
jgi:diguanylate cyclase (GGDEF)-like protein/PAS domain S-box-containing protein